jgi:cadmium resistance protein CadD (predicted permease)
MQLLLVAVALVRLLVLEALPQAEILRLLLGLVPLAVAVAVLHKQQQVLPVVLVAEVGINKGADRALQIKATQAVLVAEVVLMAAEAVVVQAH